MLELRGLARARTLAFAAVLAGCMVLAAMAGLTRAAGSPDRPPAGDPDEIAGPGARPPEEGAEHTVYAWYLGVPVISDYVQPAFLGGTGPDTPVPEVPDLNLYLIGPTSTKEAYSAPRALPSPPFPKGANVLPSHHNTVDQFVGTKEERRDAIGYFVVAGPKAELRGKGKDVWVRKEPKHSIPGAPLAYAIRIGNARVPLTSHLAIEYGVASDQLKLIRWDQGFGGQNWSTFPDPLKGHGVVTTLDRGVHLAGTG